MSSIMNFLFGKQGGFEQVPIGSEQQRGLIGQLGQGVGAQLPQAFQSLSQLFGDPEQMLQQLQAPALRQFNEQTIPGIAERFTSAGGQRSSAFGQQLGQAGAGLAEQLGAQRATLGPQLQQQGMQQLMQLLSGAFQPSEQTTYREGTKGGIGDIINLLTQLAPMFL